jgi:hypothetical protein
MDTSRQPTATGLPPHLVTSVLPAVATHYARGMLEVFAPLPLSLQTMTENVAKEPIAMDDADARTDRIHARLRAELKRLSVPERELSIWLVRAERLASRLGEVLSLARKRRPPGLATGCRRPLANLEKISKRRGGLARVLLASQLRTDREALALIEATDRLWHRKLRAAFRSVHPRSSAATVAGEWLTDMMIAHTEQPQCGLVAAILIDAGLLTRGRCWQTSPFFSTSGAGKKWCARTSSKRACCAPDGTGSLRCSKATARFEQLMKTGKGRKMGP